MAKTDTSEAESAPATRTIELEYDGGTWSHTVREPSPGQLQQMLGLLDAKGLGATKATTPEQQQILNRRSFRFIRLAGQVAEGLHVDVGEYDRLRGAIARGDGSDRLIYQVIVKTIEAFGEAEPANREERRARARRS